MPPRLATPHIVLAAEPPLISTAAAEGRVELDRPFGLDQLHRALDQAVVGEERVAGVGDDVDEGVADADHVVAGRRRSTRDRTSGRRARATTLPAAIGAVAGRAGARGRTRRPPVTIARVTMTETPTLDPYRLPRAAVPRHYDVELTPDLAAATFEGRVTIDVELVEPVEELVLNAIELDILDVTVDGSDAGHRLEPETERLFVVPIGGLQPGRVTLVITFTGTINDKLRGFYRSTFKDEAGVEHVIATTQMQADRLPPGLPVLGRARLQGRPSAITLVVDPAHDGGVQRLGDRPRGARRRRRPPPCRRPLRRHHGDEHLPRRLRRRAARGHRPGGRRRHPAAHRPRARARAT